MATIATNVVDVYPYRLVRGTFELLALRRAPGLTLAGTWQAVSGLIEEGEAAWQAGLRELREETGLGATRLLIVEPLATFYVPWLDRVIVAPAFAALVEEGPVILSDEHDDFAWCAPEEMLARVEWPNQRAVVRELSTIVHDEWRLALRDVPLDGPRPPWQASSGP
jgi:dATP pyrophosphohydrolase